jgi:DNA-binding winged helix-turn-helix (wHTH) protein
VAAEGKFGLSSFPSLIRFDLFELDVKSGQLRRRGLPVDLAPQALRVLAMLAERPGELVSRKEMKEALWPGESYGDFDSRVNFAVRKLREALNDNAEQPRYVRTVRNAGYMFIAPVREQSTARSRTSAVDLAEESIDRGGQPTPPRRNKRLFRRSWFYFAAVLFGLIVIGTAAVLASRLRSEGPAVFPALFAGERSHPAAGDPGNVIEIASVTPIYPLARQRIVIRGRGFGLHVPYARTDSPYLAVRDQSAHWAAGRVIPWNWDEVMLDVESWTDTELVISGFSGDYGRNGWKLSAGDRLEIAVWNPQSGAGPTLCRVRVTAGKAP